MNMPTALVVDDDPAINKLVQRQLGLLGFHTQSCDDIAAAKRALATQAQFEFVLSDINMPGGSGLELANWVNKHHSGLPIYLMTGRPTESWAKELRDNNIQGILLKPFQIRDLSTMLAPQFDRLRTPPPYQPTPVKEPALSL